MARKKKAPVVAIDKPEEVDPGILAHFGMAEDKPVGTTQKAQEGPTIDDLMKRIDAMGSQMESLQKTNFALMQQAPQTTVTQQKPTDVSYDGLPDPVTDPAGYAKELSQRIRTSMTAEQENRQSQQSLEASREEKVNQLWVDFGKKFTSYAEDQDKAAFAAQKVIQEAKARGVDPEKYMFVSRDQFMQDVANKMDEVFGKPKDLSATEADADEGDDDETDDEADNSRSASVFGGFESGGRAPATSRQAEQSGSIVADLTAIQRKTGFH